jgi:hypothetical protein
MMQTLSHSEKAIVRAYSTYLARINLELTQASNRTNETAGRLTVIATFLVPMNLITGNADLYQCTLDIHIYISTKACGEWMLLFRARMNKD